MDTAMDKGGIEKLNRSQKMELLGSLVASLAQGLAEKEKKDLLQQIFSRDGDSLPVIDMVEH